MGFYLQPVGLLKNLVDHGLSHLQHFSLYINKLLSAIFYYVKFKYKEVLFQNSLFCPSKEYWSSGSILQEGRDLFIFSSL